MWHRLLFTRIDNSPLLIFRIFFGILVACESFGAIATGWVHKNLIAPKVHFPFIDVSWLAPLPNNGMYFYFVLMGIFGIFIALGYRYRFSIIVFTALWTAVYLMQKTAYNNHYYLLILISVFMCFFPADASYAWRKKTLDKEKQNSMYSYVKWAIVLQLFIVYVYASIAKLYGDWLDFGMIRILMKPVEHYPIIGSVLQQVWIHKIIGVSGILFDLLIIPALLWKPTRKIAFIVSIFFHLFNAVVFQIGIFPFLSLAFTVFFFDAETIRSLFFKHKTPYINTQVATPSYATKLLVVLALYFAIQLLLPIRHYALQDNVLWTEEGHRMSWRMMLRTRSGKGHFSVVNVDTNEKTRINLTNYLTPSQHRKVLAYPDFAWQFAQHLKKEYASQGVSVAVYLEQSRISVNDRPYAPFINPETNLANAPWLSFSHHSWILPSQLD